MNDYEYDVFISYRRLHPRTVNWVKDKFLPLFQEELGSATGYNPKIFLDTKDIPNGTLWPEYLKHALCASKCIVPVFCAYYFQSEWCSREFAVFHSRFTHLMGEVFNPNLKLIHPIRIKDVYSLPQKAKALQSTSFSEYYTGCKNFDESPKYMLFEKEVEKFATEIGRNIKDKTSFPKWNPDWMNQDVNSHPIDDVFQKDFYIKQPIITLQNG